MANGASLTPLQQFSQISTPEERQALVGRGLVGRLGPQPFFEHDGQLFAKEGVIPTTIEELIAERSPQALETLIGGTRRAIDLSGQFTEAARRRLEPFADQQALQEQAALLGVLGPESQAEALQGLIPTDVEREQTTRERRALLRQRAAAGGLGGGATIQALQGLAGAQQGQLLQRRLQELEELSGISRGALSAISGLEETAGAREAALLAGLGPQQANILLGTAAPIVEARQQQAALSGLQGLASAQQRGQIAEQVANLAGQTNLFGLGSFFQQPPLASQSLAAAPAVAQNALAGFTFQPRG